MLKGGFVNIQQKFFRMFGLTKLKLPLAFTIAGYNVECIRSFNARKAAEVESAEAKRKHRRGHPEPAHPTRLTSCELSGVSVLSTPLGGVFSELPDSTVSGTSGGPPTG